ncbi:hypothetical protein [Lactococcus sp. DD01]|uniref:hypothetical protein n=1 Tax=Lactococcus sp. DD01 TaxID=1776443 RepID=UPI000796CB04|nr:hypothetical protein [Lactococcus sp. DD01]KXT60324.1 Co-activator protein [Lactococcus sp. DD01]
MKNTIRKKENKNCYYYRGCISVLASCDILMYQSTWLPCDPNWKEIWVESIPENSIKFAVLQNWNVWL